MVAEFSVRIMEVIRHNDVVKSFRTEVPEGFRFEAGQYLGVIAAAGPGMTKPLSLSNSPTEQGYLEFTKKITSSDFSKKLDQLVPGDAVGIRGPFGRFVFDPGFPKVALVSGGIGITPIRSLCKYLVDRQPQADIVLVYGNNTERDIVFGKDFEAMRQNFAGLKVVHVIKDGGPQWKGCTGFISDEILRREVPDYGSRKYYVCGPQVMVDCLKGILIDKIGISRERLVTENFVGYGTE